MKLIKNSIYIFKTDWIRILKNPLTLIVITGLMVIPSLYAWFNIEALWDPYGNASNLPIGIYSADIGYDINGENINVGEGVVDVLKDDHQLDWQFTNSKEELNKNVQDGTFYGSIYIPKDFTKKLFSIVNGEYEKPKLEYTVNEKINAIAPKMTEAGAEGMTAEIIHGFNQALSAVVLEVSNELGIELSSKLPLFNQVFNKIHKLNAKADEFTDFLEILNNINNDIPNLQSNIEDKDLEKILTKLDNTVDTIHNFTLLMTNIENQKETINQVFESSNSIDDFSKIIHNLNISITKIDNGLNNVYNYLETENINFEKYMSILEKIEQSDEDLDTILNKLNITLEDIEKLINEIFGILQNSLDLLERLVLQIEHIANNLSNFLSNTSLSPSDIASIINALNNLNTTLTTTLNIISTAKGMLIILNGGGTFTPIITILSDLEDSIDILQSKINYLINNIYSLDMTSIISYLDDIVQDAQYIVRRIEDINLGHLENELYTILNDLEDKVGSGFLEDLNISKLNDTLLEVQNILATLDNYATSFLINYESIKTFVNDLDIFLTNNKDDMKIFFENVNMYIQNDLENIVFKLKTLDDFLQDNWSSIRQSILNGNDLLLKGLPQTKEVLDSIEVFSTQTWTKLDNFLKELDKEVTKISENDELENVIDYLITDVKKGSDFIAEPVELETIRMYPVDNYGSASTPFYTTLCLWVGAVLLTSVLSTHFHKKGIKRKLTDREVFLGRFLTFLSIAIIQALIVSIGDVYLLGIEVVSPYWFIIFTLIISVCFTSIIYTLANLFGNVGKALAVIGLVLSISSGGGNFPIEVSGKFFQIINPLLPFTHGVNLLREPIGGIYPPTVYSSLIILGLYTIIFLLIGLFGANIINPIMKRLEEKSHESHIFH